jgi:hypothetical protein
MKDISPRLFVLIVAIALIAAVVYLTAIKAMAESITSAFFLSMAATLPGMISAIAGVKSKDSSSSSTSDPPASGPTSGVSTLAKLTTPAASVVMTLAALATMILAGCLLPSCTTAQQQQGARILGVSADVCVAIAKARGRDDVATVCGITEDAAKVIEAALEERVCAVSDAGAD